MYAGIILQRHVEGTGFGISVTVIGRNGNRHDRSVAHHVGARSGRLRQDDVFLGAAVVNHRCGIGVVRQRERTVIVYVQRLVGGAFHRCRRRLVLKGDRCRTGDAVAAGVSNGEGHVHHRTVAAELGLKRGVLRNRQRVGRAVVTGYQERNEVRQQTVTVLVQRNGLCGGGAVHRRIDFVADEHHQLTGRHVAGLISRGQHHRSIGRHESVEGRSRGNVLRDGNRGGRGAVVQHRRQSGVIVQGRVTIGGVQQNRLRIGADDRRYGGVNRCDRKGAGLGISRGVGRRQGDGLGLIQLRLRDRRSGRGRLGDRDRHGLGAVVHCGSLGCVIRQHNFAIAVHFFVAVGRAGDRGSLRVFGRHREGATALVAVPVVRRDRHRPLVTVEGEQ